MMSYKCSYVTGQSLVMSYKCSNVTGQSLVMSYKCSNVTGQSLVMSYKCSNVTGKLPSSLGHVIWFEHQIHSPEVIMLLCLTANHIKFLSAKQASC